MTSYQMELIKSQGYLIKTVIRSNKTNARIYLPTELEGRKVKIILLDD